MTYAVAIDIGGTFTDLVAFDPVAETVRYTQSPTTYGNFVTGILDCLSKANLSPADVTLINHGTTLVINALIQRLGGRTALVTTRGFRDVLEIARGNRRIRSTCSTSATSRSFRANCALKCRSAWTAPAV